MAAAGPRKQAMLVGSKRYFTGIPCVRGHVADRFVSTKACIQCASMFKMQWAKNNLARILTLNKQWNASNPEHLKKWRHQYYLKNQARYYAASKRRKISKRQRTPAWADLRAIEAVYSEARKQRDHGNDVVVDHIIPLHGDMVSGLHVHNNLQYLGAHFNKVKSNSFRGN